MDCPRCQATMTLRHEGLYEDIPVHACGGCGALWMAPDSLDRLDDNINVEASKLDWRPTKSRDMLRCPLCPGGYREGGSLLEPLGLVDAPDFAIHRCRRCKGLLVDDEALDGIRSVVIER